jgi:tetratricopeptide (TPR) repeat protein
MVDSQRPLNGRVDDADAHELYDSGRDAMQHGDYEHAIKLFTESVARSPHFKTLELLGECFLRTGRPRDSIVPLAAAVTLNRQARAAILLAESFLQLKDFSKASAFVEVALEREPHSSRAKTLKAAITDAQAQ